MTTEARRVLFVAAMLVLLAAACSPQSVPVTGATQKPTVPVLVAPTNPSGIQALQAVPPGPPAMQAGSAYRYFDGALLDAIPNDGPFTMGGSPDEAQTQVVVGNFWIYSTEVTNQMYAWCVSLGKCSPPDKHDNPDFSMQTFVNYPVVGVTWQQAADYCTFAHARLPTEAEWEKTAGWDATAKQQRLYPWGDKDPSCDYLNYRGCLGHPGPALAFGLGQSYYGAYNMAGNVSEWVADWFQPGYKSGGQDPQGPAHGTQRAVRGAAFGSDAMFASPSRRFSADPTDHRDDLGFRCVVQDAAYFAPYCQMPVFYGIDPAATPSSNPCPDPQINSQETCGFDFKPHYTLSVRNSGSTLVQVTGLESCNPAGNDLGVPHECGPGSSVTVRASCPIKPGGSVACPPNYQQDPKNPDRCISPGGPGACPAGFQYNGSIKCCSSAPQNTNVPLCSVGQHFYNGSCVDDSSGLQQPASFSVVIPTAESCIPGLAVPGAGATATATLVPFPTWTPFRTLTPFPTSTPTQFVSTATPTPTFILFPTATNTPTTVAPTPTDTQSAPTDTPQATAPPQPTSTPQPTDTPLPTSTSAPPATATPTP